MGQQENCQEYVGKRGDAVEVLDMSRSKTNVANKPVAPQNPPQNHPSSMLAMLESLADAIETKADSILDAGDSDDDVVRARTLKDVSDAIRERFGS